MNFPTRDNCNPDDPEEAFLWMLVALPYQQGAQLVMPISYLRFISKRLWECGARPVSEPIIKYRPPTGSEPNWMTSPGRWVDVGEELPEPTPMSKAVAALTQPQRAELLAELQRQQ